MDWQGIAWVVPFYEIAMIVLPVYAFITIRRRAKQGVLRKSRAMLSYAALVFAPVLVYSLFFFALIAFEELTAISVVPEELARTFLLLVGFGFAICLVATCIFGAAVLFIKKQHTSSPSDSHAPSE